MPESGVIEVTPGLLREWRLPAHPHGATKQSRGQVLVVGGAAQTPGAVLLAAVASLRAGAGKLAIATVASSAPALGVGVPEALVQALPETATGAVDPRAMQQVLQMASSANAVLFGPGMTDEEACCRLLLPILEQLGDVSVVLDALALAVVERDPAVVRRVHRTAVLTPNREELGYMLGSGDSGIDRPSRAVCDAARRFGAVVSLGGGETLIADPDGGLWHESTGDVGLGVSGSGDCAAGIVAGLLARGAEPAQAAVWGAHLHGSAGDRLAARMGRVGYLAREIADEIPQVLSIYE